MAENRPGARHEREGMRWWGLAGGRMRNAAHDAEWMAEHRQGLMPGCSGRRKGCGEAHRRWAAATWTINEVGLAAECSDRRLGSVAATAIGHSMAL